MDSEQFKQAQEAKLQAERARRLAKGLSLVDQESLLLLAQELEQQAAEFERQFGSKRS